MKKFLVFLSLLFSLRSCFLKDAFFCYESLGLVGVNKSDSSAYFAVGSKLGDLSSIKKKNPMDYCTLVKNDGEKMVFFSRNTPSWQKYFSNQKNIAIHVICDTIVIQYGWDYVIDNNLFSVSYSVPVKSLSPYETFYFPPIEQYDKSIEMIPPYEKVIAKYGKSE